MTKKYDNLSQNWKICQNMTFDLCTFEATKTSHKLPGSSMGGASLKLKKANFLKLIYSAVFNDGKN